jgi:2-methylaconitate cis-trans-isomerase PrpF
MQTRIPAVYMRGGTSKAVFFRESHLPTDPKIRDQVILAAFGSPDPNRRQIDGMGGSFSSASKVAIISPSEDPTYDVVYNFGQVSIDCPIVDYRGNCGNISSAVGPYAVDEGLVKVEEPVTRVRIYQKNTKKLIESEVPVMDGHFNEEGDYTIAGIPGTGSKITLHFFNPGGSVTDRLFPTGNVMDILDVQGIGKINITVIDAANPVALVSAKDLGLTGREIEEIDRSETLRNKLEAIRSRAAVLIGLASTPEEASQHSQAVPKIAFVTPPTDYRTVGGTVIGEHEADLVARMISMGALHRAFPVTGAIPTVGAAKIEGTIVHEMLGQEASEKEFIRLGHPGGIIEIGARVEKKNNSYEYSEAILGRTARRLMEGYVLVPNRSFQRRTAGREP